MNSYTPQQEALIDELAGLIELQKQVRAGIKKLGFSQGSQHYAQELIKGLRLRLDEVKAQSPRTKLICDEQLDGNYYAISRVTNSNGTTMWELHVQPKDDDEGFNLNFDRIELLLTHTANSYGNDVYSALVNELTSSG